MFAEVRSRVLTRRPVRREAGRGREDVTLLDARAPAEFKGFEGNTMRLGHIPGAVNVPVGATSLPGSQPHSRLQRRCPREPNTRAVPHLAGDSLAVALTGR